MSYSPAAAGYRSNCSTLFWMINENKEVFEKYSDCEWYKSLIAKLEAAK